jgi:D-3-phosphoglycerate dehydrogenase
VLNTDPRDHRLDDELCRQIEVAGGVVAHLDSPTDDAFAGYAREAFAVLNSDFLLTAERIAALERCRVISRFGTGVDNIDVAAAAARGIVVANVPEFCTDEVANRVWLLLLACAAHLPELDQGVRRGEWREEGLGLSMPVSGRVLGLVGLGKIGRAVARRGQASGMRIIACDPLVSGGQMAKSGIEKAELDALLAEADYVSVGCPLTDETRALIDARRIGLMKRTAVLINCARGAIVDQAALADALANHRIAAAGLDVFDPEPPGRDNPLYRLQNVILTPHSAANTADSIRRLRREAVESVVRVLRGERPRNTVTP